MGVQGLWRLIEPTGKPVPLESLENKVLAIDVSIWLHQAIKGFQDARGASVPNAHLLGIYHRVCKLLYFKIKPIFVFDGGVPVLKKQTIAKRTQSKLRTMSEADKIQRELLSTLVKHTAVSKVLMEKIEESLATMPKVREIKPDEMYILPPQLDSTISSSDDEEGLSTSTDSSPNKYWDLHNIDMNSKQFKSLPVDVRHDILTDLKETRKQNSWGRLHELPQVSDDFSIYQMKRLLKRQAVQVALEEAEKEMGGKSLSLAELESLLQDQGVINNDEIGKRIASDEHTKYLLVKDVKKAIDEAKKLEMNEGDNELEDDDLERAIAMSLESTDQQPSTSEEVINEFEEDLEKAIAMSLESKQQFSDSDFSSSSSDEAPERIKPLSSAESYMKEYSGLTPNEINKIMKNNEKKQTKPVKLTEIVEENKAELMEKIMSCTDDDSEDEKVPKITEDESEGLEIVVDLQEDLKEDDDLFADIFQSPNIDLNVIGEAILDQSVEIMSSSDSSEDGDLSAQKGDDKIEVEEFNNIQQDNIIEEPIVEQPKEPEIINKKVTEEELQILKHQLAEDKAELIQKKSTKDRMAANITDKMYQEAQELLELFGIPYIVAPMEAEAQCAFLDAINLTDGTITDDSDIWLFGGRTVYKNFFNQSKHVMEFKSESIQHCFKLTREQMVLLAMLVGSDYTCGITGIGPVTALEILAAFPSKNDIISGLKDFRSWFVKGKSSGPGRNKLKTKLKHLEFTENFPSLQVVEAYMRPTVDESKERFSWAAPNFPALIEFAREKFGWTKLKAEEILGPVVRRLKDTKHQPLIKDYFTVDYQQINSDVKMSKRVKDAVTNIGRDPNELLQEEVKQPKIRSVKKRGTEAPEFADKLPKKAASKRAKNDKPKLSKLTEELEDVAAKIDVIKRRRKLKESQVETKKLKIPKSLKHDEEVQMLTETVTKSNKRVEEIKQSAVEVLNKISEIPTTSRGIEKRKETIPQKERDRTELLRNKLKAIEVFRKSKRGPGFVKKRETSRRLPKGDAELSESSD